MILQLAYFLSYNQLIYIFPWDSYNISFIRFSHSYVFFNFSKKTIVQTKNFNIKLITNYTGLLEVLNLQKMFI